MPDMVRITQRAMELIAQRTARVVEDLTQQQQDAMKSPQRRMRADYEQVRDAPAEQADVARAAFDAQYGPQEWQRQQTLDLRRQARDEGQPQQAGPQRQQGGY